MDKETAFTKFTDEITNGEHTDKNGRPLTEYEIHWEPLWYGWALSNGISFENANDWYAEFRYEHYHNYTPDDE